MRVGSLAMSVLVLNCTMAWGASLRMSALGDSCLVIPAPPGYGTFAVEAVDLGRPDCDGLAGAQFRITGLPQGWTAIATPNPIAGIIVGDLFGDGVSIFFNAGQHADPLLLYSVNLEQ
jgi:hypothetical protein